MYFIGIDLGSTTGKVLIMDENKKVLGRSIVRSARGPKATVENAFKKAIEQAGITDLNEKGYPKDAYIVATGYGRGSIEGINEEISEISCHAKGASYLYPSTRTIIDIGGQDCKVISIDDTGKVLDFQMNDKCSAGTGRFFEVMCRVLDIELPQLAEEALKSSKPCQISKQCSVFAESEVISLVNNNVPLCDISAGIHDSIARRIHGMAFKVGIEPDVVLTGGCAQNPALKKALEKKLKVKLGDLGENPQIVGALGAALFALQNHKGS